MCRLLPKTPAVCVTEPAIFPVYPLPDSSNACVLLVSAASNVQRPIKPGWQRPRGWRGWRGRRGWRRRRRGRRGDTARQSINFDCRQSSVVDLHFVQTAVKVVAQRRVSGLPDPQPCILLPAPVTLSGDTEVEAPSTKKDTLLFRRDRNRDMVPLAVIDLGHIGGDLVAVHGGVVGADFQFQLAGSGGPQNIAIAMAYRTWQGTLPCGWNWSS